MFTATAVAPQQRRLVALDIENINGGSVRFTSDAAAAWDDVARAIDLKDSEHVVVGVGPSSLVAAAVGHPAARYVLARGRDGADRALLEVLENENIAQRFDQVVIASGDGIFAEAAARLAASGTLVTIVARKSHLSKRLRMAAGAVRILPDSGYRIGEAA